MRSKAKASARNRARAAASRPFRIQEPTWPSCSSELATCSESTEDHRSRCDEVVLLLCGAGGFCDFCKEVIS